MSFSKSITYELGQICDEVSYGYTASADWKIDGPKFLRITDIQNYFVDWESVPQCAINDNDHNKYKLEEGDIVIARTGATTGANYTFRGTIDAVFASYLIKFKINKKIANPFYIGYILKSESWNSFVASIIGGSAQPGANAKQFSNFKIRLPELATQNRITSILSNIDNSIELNLQNNKTLDELCRVLFKEWFTNFNYPNSPSIYNITKELPPGWRIEKLGELIEIKGGTTPSTSKSEYWDGKYYWATPKDLSNLQTHILLDTNRKITEKGLKQISSGVLPKGTLLLSSRAPIGYLAISEVPISINQGFIAINGKKISNLFMLYWLKENMQTIINNANGSTFLEISKSVFRNINIILPEQEVLERFEKIISNIYDQILKNEKENQTLCELRNKLLPKLINGQIQIKS